MESKDLKEKLKGSLIALEEIKSNSLIYNNTQGPSLDLIEEKNINTELGKETLKEISNLKKDLLGLSATLKV